MYIFPTINLTQYEKSVPINKWQQPLKTAEASQNFCPEFAQGLWKINLLTSSCLELSSRDATDYLLSVALEKGTAHQVSFGLEFQHNTWSRDHFVVLPGAVYEGNRFLSKLAGYPPIAAETGTVGAQVPIVINDIPRLSLNPEEKSILQLLSADMSTPAMGFYDPQAQEGVWIFTPQSTRYGLTGFTLGESENGNRAVLRLTAPGVREGHRYHCFQTDRESPDRAVDWNEQEYALLSVRVFRFACSSRLELLRRFTEIRHTFHPAAPTTPIFPLSAARQLIEEKYNRDNWNVSENFYATDTFKIDQLPSWQSGWIGGGMSNYPLLTHGSTLTSSRAQTGLDYICTHAVSPSGFFRSMCKEGKWIDDSFGHSKNGEFWHMTRKSADLLLFLLKQISWLRENPSSSSSASLILWEKTARGCADAFVKLWTKEKQIGQFVDENSGELLVGQSDSAAILPAALALAGEVFDHPKYKQTALETGLDYWQRFQRQGFTTGGPGEILSAPDSESAFGLLEGFVKLWETTHDAAWLTRAEAAGDYCSTWCVSYDFVFPTASTFGALHMSSTGTVIANAQNKHSSPGICTLSGDSLLRLYRATGRDFYLNLIREIATSLPQYVSRSDRPITARSWGKGSMPSGWICERVNLSDWLEPVGEIFYGSCWCEVSVLLTAVELPSIYFQPDTGLLVSFDHVHVKILERSKDGKTWILEIINPTPFPAQIRVLVETKKQSALPLPNGACVKLPIYEIGAGQTYFYHSER